MGLGDIEGEVFWSTATTLTLWGTISWLWPAGFWPRKRCRRGRESATQSRGQGAAGQPRDLGTWAGHTSCHGITMVVTFFASQVSALRGNVQRSGSGRVMWSRCFSRCQKLLLYVLEVGASIESWILQGQPRAFCKVASFVAWGCCCQLGTRGWRSARWAYWFRTPSVWLLLEWKWSVQRLWVRSSFPALLQRRTRTLTAPRRKQLGYG